MVYRVVLKPRSKRELSKLPNRLAERIACAIDALATLPRPPGCVKMAGPDGFWRIRIGDYRVVYEIHDDRLIILIVRVGHRRDVYD